MATAFGMIILLAGVFFIFIGQMFPNLQNRGIFCAAWIFGGMFIGIGGNPAVSCGFRSVVKLLSWLPLNKGELSANAD